MTDRAKAILARLGARPNGFDPVIHGGAIPEIDRELVASALAGAPALGAMICLAKYANDNNAGISATQLVEAMLKNVECAEAMARLIVAQEINPGFDRCGQCGGRGETINRVCPRCEGAKRIARSERYVARFCNVERTAFQRAGYMRVYLDTRAAVQESETATLYHVDRRVFNG